MQELDAPGSAPTPQLPRGERARSVIALVVVSGTIAVALASYPLAFDRAMPSGDGLSSSGRLFFSRALVVILGAELALFAILLRRRTVQVVRRFFAAPAHPLNLALFRVVVAASIFREVDLPQIISFSRLPPILQFPPYGMRALLPHLPIDERTATMGAVLLLVFSLTCLIGLFSRISAALCVALGVYVLGIPQFYGKVDHYQHLLWFAALLAVSPCGDVLSLDAIFAARRRADVGITDPPAPSCAYALPLSFVMLLIGVIYFFPGMWKLWESGIDWILSDNLKFQLYRFWTWSYNGTWLPSFRIDQHPRLCKLGAAAAVLFETSFVFFVFFRNLRAIAALQGIAFHAFTRKFMLIFFVSLQAAYVAMFDWASIFCHVGRRLYRDQMVFYYDGSCHRCVRLIASLRTFDVFRRVTYLNVRDGHGIESAPSNRPNVDGLDSLPWAVIKDETWVGFPAYRALAWRIPFLWPAIPLFLAWPRAILRQRASHSAASSNTTTRNNPSDERAGRPPRTRLVGTAVIGGVLLSANVWCGINGIVSGWPFACYPTFSSPPGTEVKSIGVVAVMASRQTMPVEIQAIPHHRLYGIYENILATSDRRLRRRRLEALWRVACDNDSRLRTATSARFYEETLWTFPELWKSNPKDRQLLLELNLADLGP